MLKDHHQCHLCVFKEQIIAILTFSVMTLGKLNENSIDLQIKIGAKVLPFYNEHIYVAIYYVSNIHTYVCSLVK